MARAAHASHKMQCKSVKQKTHSCNTFSLDCIGVTWTAVQSDDLPCIPIKLNENVIVTRCIEDAPRAGRGASSIHIVTLDSNGRMHGMASDCTAAQVNLMHIAFHVENAPRAPRAGCGASSIHTVTINNFIEF